MQRYASIFGAATALAGVVVVGTAATPGDPLAFITPSVVITAAERERLARGDVVVRILPARDGEVAVFAAAKVQATFDAMVAWTREIDQLKRSPFVPIIRRFSDPPMLQDLDDLTMDDGDLEALRSCRPGNCGVKLGGDDIAALRAAVAQSGAGWKEAVQRQFRQIVLKRVNVYRSGGFDALPAYVDRTPAVVPADLFAGIMSRSAFLASTAPDVATRLTRYPIARESASESFYYWSREQYGRGKPVFSVTHVDMVRRPDEPGVLVASKEIFATHYRNASLGVTALAGGDAAGGTYLVYMNRSNLDVLGGVFGGVKRAVLEARVRSETSKLIGTIRERIASGPPGRR